MQVNRIDDKVTHAVIGGNKARDFSISNSAEFFDILSSTLYSDKIMAVVREVLCNAWDIHIQTGRTDKPVEIILTNTKLEIRDHGTGIHDDDMVAVYCTYGSSTKKNDGKQTGGFGLGCKAPFAQVDHFEVTSYHEGKKTIYAISKSSAEVAGKPSIMPIVCVPTDESGLLVSMAIKPEDERRYRDVIKTIVAFGEMNAVMNNEALPTIPFSQAKNGFAIMERAKLMEVTGAKNSNIFCRYGNVIYPVPSHADFAHEENRILKMLKILDSGHYESNKKIIILQAKPNTISVTPSRESLSMTPHTITALRDLMTEFLSMSENQLKEECIRIEQDLISKAWITGSPALLLTSDNALPTLFKDSWGGRKTWNTTHALPSVITNIPDISQTYMTYSYPNFAGFRQKDIEMRLQALEGANFGNRGKIQSFRREYAAKGNIITDWFQRRIIGPLMVRMKQTEGMDPSKLMVRAHHKPAPTKNGRARWAEVMFVKANELSERRMEDYLPFLRNFVVLAYNRPDILDRLPNFPIMQHWFGSVQDILAYTVSRVAGKAEEARKFFESQGYTVVDLTKAYKWEEKDVVEPKVTTVAKPRKKGLPRLDGAFTTSGTLSFEAVRLDDVVRIEKPEFVCQIVTARYDSGTKALYSYSSAGVNRAIRALFGKRGGVCVNANQYSKFTGMDVPPIQQFLAKAVYEEVITNPRIIEALGCRIPKLPTSIQSKVTGYSNREAGNLLNAIVAHPELGKVFNMTNVLTQTDRYYIEIAEDLLSAYAHMSDTVAPAEVPLLREFIKNVKPNPAYSLLANKLGDASDHLPLLDIDNLVALFPVVYTSSGDMALPSPTIAKKRSLAIDLLTYALEG